MNPYAALPSLHFGWALLLAVGLWQARPSGRRGMALLAVVALLIPLGQFFAVIMTANHFVLDLVAGAAVAGLGLAGALWWQRRGAREGERELVEPALID